MLNGKGKGQVLIKSAAYMRQSGNQKHFTISIADFKR